MSRTREPKNYRDTVIPGHRAALCLGCGAFVGYAKDWGRVSIYCTPSCLTRRPPSPDETRNRDVATIFSNLNIRQIVIAEIMGIKRQSVNHILKKYAAYFGRD